MLPPDATAIAAPRPPSSAPRAPVRRVVRLALRMGVALLASGAQTTDTEASLRGVMRALGLPGAEAAVTFSTVSISFIAPGDAQATTAMQMVRTWRPDFTKLAATAALARDIRNSSVDLAGAEAALDRIAGRATPHPRAVAFIAPGISAAAATILFGGTPADAAATLAIALAIQPFLARLARSELPPFFQVGFGVSATAALVVLLVAPGAKRALAVAGGMVALLALGIVPSAVAGLLAAGAIILTGVMTIQQAYRAINWTTVVLVGAMLPLSTAMTQTGAAELVADGLVAAVRDLGPYALLAGLFLVTMVFSQLISNMATALIVIPIAAAAAIDLGIDIQPVLMTVTVAAAAALLTPVATPVNLMIMGPAGYRFSDYWKLGLAVMAVFFVVAVFLVPVFWPFG